MKKFLVTGPDIDKLHQEERIRMERGDIRFYPLPEDFDIDAFLASLDEDADDKGPDDEDPAEGDAPAVVDEPSEVPDILPSDNEETPSVDEQPAEVPPTDDKTPEVDDLKEFDLDSDTKEVTAEDTKDVPAADAKEETTAKKTSKRTKKSE